MKLYAVLSLALVTIFVNACQSSGGGGDVKVFPRAELQVKKPNDTEPRQNSLLVEGKGASTVIRDFTYIAEADGTLTVGEVVPLPVNCEGTPQYKMNWIRVDANGQEVGSEAVTADSTEIKVNARSNYILRVEINGLKCSTYSLVFQVNLKEATPQTKQQFGLSNAGQKEETAEEKKAREEKELAEKIKKQQEEQRQNDQPKQPSGTTLGV